MTKEKLLKFREGIELESLGRSYILWTEDHQEFTEWYQAFSLYCIQTSFKQHYQITDIIGKGSFSTVYNGFYVQKFQRVAIKSMLKETIMRNSYTTKGIIQELDILRSLSHAHIVKLYGVFETAHEVNIILENLRGGDLLRKLKRKGVFSEVHALKIFVQILLALKYIHSLGIIHRDIKPENILFENDDEYGKVKLSDFGMAARLPASHTCLYQQCGTPGYLSPEMITRKGYTQKSDIYSAGCVLYSLYFIDKRLHLTSIIRLSGRRPFEDTTVRKIILRNMENDFDFPPEQWAHISMEAKNLVSMLMKKNPDHRLSAEAALEHPAILKATASEALLMPLEEKKTLKIQSVAERALLLRNGGAGSGANLKVNANGVNNGRRTSVFLPKAKIDSVANAEDSKESKLEGENLGNNKSEKKKSNKRTKILSRKVSNSVNAGEEGDVRIYLEGIGNDYIPDETDKEDSPTKGAVVTDEGEIAYTQTYSNSVNIFQVHKNK